MSRLTEKKIDIEKFSDKAKSRLTNEYLDKVRLYNRLCEFEDLLEEYDFEDIKTFKMAIKLMQSMNSVGVKYCAENQKLKDRWHKLKEWVIKELGYASMYQLERIEALDDVKDKMQELENGSDTNVGSKNAHYTEQKSAKDAH